ncbi:hypothetical protein ABEB36_015417 [Hypothenemus hampei]|uniref:Uncharacterized protein n=1 Tax=Hypothenemus hampei TaxID=57062 RepID=A0ABD1E057_HYPHA
MYPLKCTQNTLFHLDGGTPIVLAKYTDYRTSTGKYHDLIPNIPQYFDCRVKAKIKPELLYKDVIVRDENISSYSKHYLEKYVKNISVRNNQAGSSSNVDYTRTVQEKIFAKPPPVKQAKISEMKDSYTLKFCKPLRGNMANVTCELSETYRPVQPDINPANKGFYRNVDIYLTENRAKYVPYDKILSEQDSDFPTFYNTTGKYKGLKQELPGKLSGNQLMYDKSVFKLQLPDRIQSKAPKRVPYCGMTSEYESNYSMPTCSDFYPYCQENGIFFPESLSKSGPWQDLCSPAMYCSEQCHIGTDWPVRAVVDIGALSSGSFYSK